MQNIDQDQMQQPTHGSVPVAAKPFRPPVLNKHTLNKSIYSLYLKKQFDKCLNLIQSAQATGSSNEFHLYIKGLVFREKSQLEKSLECFMECHALDKLNHEYLKNICKGLFLLGKYKSSMEAAKEALAVREDWEVYYLLGKIHAAMDKGDDEAADYFIKSFSIQQNQQSYLQLARLLVKGGRYIKALDVLQEASRFSSQNPQILQMRGILALKNGRRDQAALYLDQALELQPFSYDSTLGRGSVHQQFGEIEKAMEKYKYSYAMSPNSAFLWNNIATCLIAKSKFLGAYSCLKKSLYLDPSQWKTYANLGLVCTELRKYVTAFVNYSLAISLNRKNSQLYVNLGMVLVELGDNSNALRAFEEALVYDSENVKAYLNAAALLLNRGERIAAIQKKQIAVKLKMDSQDKQLLAKIEQHLRVT